MSSLLWTLLGAVKQRNV